MSAYKISEVVIALLAFLTFGVLVLAGILFQMTLRERDRRFHNTRRKVKEVG